MNEIELKNLIESYPNKVTDLKKIIQQFMNSVDTIYPPEWKLFQKAYHELYLDKNNSIVLCPVCNKVPLRFVGLRHGYAKNCSASCRNKNPEFLRKYKKSCMHRFGTEFASQSQQFRETVKQTCLEKYGSESPMQNSQVKEKLKSTYIKKYGKDNPSKVTTVIKKIRDARIASGDWVSDENRSELEKYRAIVKKVSANSYHTHYYKINPNNYKRSRWQYHLDHIFSIDEGFKQNIPPEIIGHWTNLQMLWYRDNSIKNTKCSKTKEQLFEDYYKEERPA